MNYGLRQKLKKGTLVTLAHKVDESKDFVGIVKRLDEKKGRLYLEVEDGNGNTFEKVIVILDYAIVILPKLRDLWDAIVNVFKSIFKKKAR